METPFHSNSTLIMSTKQPTEKTSREEISTDSLYLSRLTFDPNLNKGVFAFFVTRFRVILLLIAILSAAGLYAFSILPRESNPEVKIPFAVVTTLYPGASPTDVEELITKKIETAVSSIQGVKKITSSSLNSVSSVAVEFDANQDLENSVRRVRDEVAGINDLPTDAEDPKVSEISFDDTPIWIASLIGPYDGFVLREHAEKIADELEKVPGVRQVVISGGNERQFTVYYDPAKLTTFGITPAEANGAIAATNIALPGGNFKGRDYIYSVRTDAQIFTAKELSAIVVRQSPQGAPITLADIARIEDGSIDTMTESRFSVASGEIQNAITLQIIKRTGGSIVDTVENVNTKIAHLMKTFSSGMRYEVTMDMAKQIQKDFRDLSRDFLITVVFVMGILFLIVGLKESVVAGIAIPLTFFATFAAMNILGVSLNFLSIFSLLLSLGILVDDAIVVVSATKQYLRTGKYTPEQAVLLVLRDFKVVLLTTTLTTVWAFLPLLFASGIIGEFIRSIPITVSVTLLGSLLIALFINHPLAAVMERVRFTKPWFFVVIFLPLLVGTFFFGLQSRSSLVFLAPAVVGLALLLGILTWYKKRGRLLLETNASKVEREWADDEAIKEKLRHQTSGNASTVDRLIHGIVKFERLVPLYERALRALVENKIKRRIFLFSVLLLFVVAASLPALGIVKTEFFPLPDEDNLYVNIEAPIGTRVEQTDGITKQVEEKLLTHPEIINFATTVGQPGIDPSSGGSGGGSLGTTTHLAGITVTLKPSKERSITSYDLADKLREEVKSIQGSTVSVQAPSAGPPSGSAFEARVLGDDLSELEKLANRYRVLLGEIPGVTDPKISVKQAPAEFTFHLDPQRMNQYGLTAASVGQYIRLTVAGVEASKVLLDNKEITIQTTLDPQAVTTLDDLQNIQIPSTNGSSIFLRDIAHVELRPAVESIRRIDQKRYISITSGVSSQTNAAQVLTAFQKKVRENPLTEGYTIEYGGENEQNQESVASILRAMIAAAALIFATLIIQFNSFRKAFIVLMTLPLALIGVFIGMGVTGIPISFPGLIGILALFGIVVKNAIILIDKMNLNLRSGIDFNDSVIDAGKSRIEAIFITSIATIAGIIPITLSNAIWKALGTAIIFGLSISSFFTLFVIPALFCELIPNKGIKK